MTVNGVPFVTMALKSKLLMSSVDPLDLAVVAVLSKQETIMRVQVQFGWMT